MVWFDVWCGKVGLKDRFSEVYVLVLHNDA